jgi:hypothetical protein
MGYRSQIAIAIDPTVYANAPDEVKEAFQEIWDEPDIIEGDRIVFKHDYIKWYDSDPTVATIEDWLSSLDEFSEYALLELGEDYSDVRMVGETMQYGLNFIREIEIA